MRKRMKLSGMLRTAVMLVIMTLPVLEADAAASASDFTTQGSQTEQNNTAQDGEDVLGSSSVVGNSAFVFWDSDNLRVYEPSGVGRQEGDDASARVSGLASALGNMAAGGIAERFPKYTVVDGKIIADGAFYRNNELGEYAIPHGIEEIGLFSFARSSLTEIRIPEGVRDIRYGAFYHCDGLVDVKLPESVMRVEPEAFAHTAWLEGFKSGGEDFLISGGVLVAYSGNEENLSVPGGVRVIAAGVFAGHEELRTVRIPDSVLAIGEAAFENCSGLQKVWLGDGVERIDDRAFFGCGSLESVRIPASVKELGLNALGSAEGIYRGSVPVSSYELSATRLANESYRGTEGQGGEAGVTVSGIQPAAASLEGARKAYMLKVEEKPADGTLERAWSRVRESGMPEQTVIYELRLTDGGGIPIVSLGRSGLTVVLPVPQELEGRELGLVTTDRNGQLEGVGVERVTLDGTECFRFRLTNISTVAVYGKGAAVSEDSGQRVE